MKLQDISKQRYRKHLNIVIPAIIASLIVLALAIGQILITLFSAGDGNNFSLNLGGVILAAITCLTVVYKTRHHHFMTEVYYIWQLKAVLNKITRKIRKIESAAIEDDNVDAIVILNYYYAACTQLYQLDDNTITMDSLGLKIEQLDGLIARKKLSIDTDDYKASMLNDF